VLDRRNDYWVKPLWIKAPLLRFLPGKCVLLQSDGLMYKLPFFRPQEVVRVNIGGLISLLRVMEPGAEQWWTSRQDRYIVQGVGMRSAHNVELLW